MKGWTVVYQMTHSKPYEYPSSEQSYMRKVAERLVKSPKVSREDRRIIERIWSVGR